MVHSKLLSDIERFIEKTGVSPTRFGQMAIGDRHLVRTMRMGRRVWPETEAKIRKFMRRGPPIVAASLTSTQASASQSERGSRQ